MTINWTKLAAVVAALAGLAGTVLVPVIGTSLATQGQAILQAVSGLLLAIGTGAVTVYTVQMEKAKALVALGVSQGHSVTVNSPVTVTSPPVPATRGAK